MLSKVFPADVVQRPKMNHWPPIMEVLLCSNPGADPGVGGLKMREWKKQEQITGVENAGVSRMEHQTKIIMKES